MNRLASVRRTGPLGATIMPSPFPGMDPYLEGEFWSGFHTELVLGIKHQLIPKLRPKYHPFTNKYQIKALIGDMVIGMEPDVAISKRTDASLPLEKAGVATQPVTRTLPIIRPVQQMRILIRDLSERKLVTVIELLSPANKNNPGRKKYLHKRDHILNSQVNLIEIDFLLKGKRPPLIEEYPSGQYFVLSRAANRPRCDVWPVSFEQRLPTVPVPLLPEDGDVHLDLQKAVADAYDAGDFGTLIDYKKTPEVRLTKEQSRWMTEHLR